MKKNLQFNTAKLGSLLPHNPNEENELVKTIHDAVLNGADDTHITELELTTYSNDTTSMGMNIFPVVENVMVSEEDYRNAILEEEGKCVLCYVFNFEKGWTDLCYVELLDGLNPFRVLQEFLPELLKLQHKLNIDTSGENYLQLGVNEKNKKFIDWDLCIKMELAELIGSLPYKHWKDEIYTVDNENINHKNIFVEHIDILHFILSRLLEVADHICTNTEEYKDKENNIENYVEILCSDYVPALSLNIMYINSISNMYQLVATEDKDFPAFLMYALSQWMKSQSSLTGDLQTWLCVNMMLERLYGFNFSSAVKLYLGKNTLNKFRLDNGYKEDTYVKIWSNVDLQETDKYISKEDNDFMVDIVDELFLTNELSFDNIYAKLDAKYKEVIESNKPMKQK